MSFSPAALETEREVLAVDLADLEAGNALRVLPAVPCDPTNQLLDDVGPDRRVTRIPKLLRGQPEIEGRHFPGLKFGREFPKLVEQVALQTGGLGKAPAGRVLHGEMDEGRDRGVVRGDSERFEKVERLAQPRRRQAGLAAKLVG